MWSQSLSYCTKEEMPVALVALATCFLPLAHPVHGLLLPPPSWPSSVPRTLCSSPGNQNSSSTVEGFVSQKE